ncbi:PKD domain-containing protein [Serinicoccus chungangensis]|nr:PKD domain-containing protein [Serinicoccus chungangensis]
MVAGGNFSRVREYDSTTEVERSFLFAFDRSSGQIKSFAPTFNGEVFQVLSSGDGQNVWVVGGFSSVNGQTERSIVKMNVHTGEVVSSFDPPAFDGRIHTIALRNGLLYVTGRFLHVGDRTQTLLAALDPQTGAVDPGVTIEFAEPRRDGHLAISGSDITPDGSTMVVIGNFQRVGGLPRTQIAMLDLSSGGVAVSDWQTNRYGDGCSSSFLSYMRAVEFSPDGSYFAVATTGAYSSTYQCDTVARWDTADRGTSLNPAWTNYTGGDTLTALAVTETAVYTGGHQRRMNNPFAADRVGPGAITREGLSAHDPRSGAVLPWDAKRTRGYGVYGFLVTPDGIWVGSDTDRIGNWHYRARLALMPLAGGQPVSADYTGHLPTQTVTVTDSGLTKRNFTGSSVTGSSVVATPDWAGVRGAFMLNGYLYTGRSDGTFRKQTYDGSTYGELENVPLAWVPDAQTASLNRFSTQDLQGSQQVTAMFYDDVTGRIYFTKAGQNQLYYRFFSRYGEVVGAERQIGPGAIPGLNWSQVRGAFLVDDHLYTSDAEGRLFRWDWSVDGGPADNRNLSPAAYSGTPVVGTGTQVSGPGVDGEMWAGRDTFVYAGAEPPNEVPVASFDVACEGAVCDFDAGASSDSDGEIARYAWDFGDGTSAGAGEVVSHTYAVGGSYEVTLVVTDDRGESATVSQQVSVDVPNVEPTAELTVGCSGLDCDFDGSGSVDSDGQIVDYLWDFGDESEGSAGVSTSHTYAEPGQYTVALTVVDDRGGESTVTEDVRVVDPEQTAVVSFRDVTSSNGNTRNAQVTVPGSVEAGDTMVLVATLNSDSRSLTGPEGWTLLKQESDPTASAMTAAWVRTAGENDAGSEVSVALSAYTKTSLQLVAYADAAGVGEVVQAFDTESGTQRTTPVVDVTVPGSTVVSVWGNKSSVNTTWEISSPATLRDLSVGDGSGHILQAIADSGPLGVGPAGGLTAETESADRRGILWSIVIPPVQSGL